MFTKEDTKFDEMALDPMRRRAHIANLSWRRTVVLCCAVGLILVGVIEMWTGKGEGGLAGAAIALSIGLKLDSNLRLLRIIERLQKGGDEKTAA